MPRRPLEQVLHLPHGLLGMAIGLWMVGAGLNGLNAPSLAPVSKLRPELGTSIGSNAFWEAMVQKHPL